VLSLPYRAPGLCRSGRSHVSDAVKSTDNNAYKFEKGDVDFGYAGWFLWPNLTIWAYPGEANLSVLQMNPSGVERTVEFQDWFTKSETPSAQLRDAMDYQKDILQPEDIGLCVSVQKGTGWCACNSVVSIAI